MCGTAAAAEQKILLSLSLAWRKRRSRSGWRESRYADSVYKRVRKNVPRLSRRVHPRLSKRDPPMLLLLWLFPPFSTGYRSLENRNSPRSSLSFPSSRAGNSSLHVYLCMCVAALTRKNTGHFISTQPYIHTGIYTVLRDDDDDFLSRARESWRRATASQLFIFGREREGGGERPPLAHVAVAAAFNVAGPYYASDAARVYTYT